MTSDAPPERPRRSAPIAGVIIGAVVAAAVCGWLGLWQWDRAHTRAATVRDQDPVPIAEVAAPSADASDAVGRTVTVTGTWGDDAALVWGREVDGVPSVFLVRSLVVPADETGTGGDATLAVIVGHRPADQKACPDDGPGEVTVTGYFRSSEAPPTRPVASEPDWCGLRATDVVSVAELAQTWDGPLYSAVLVSDDGSPAWPPLPARPPITRLNLQSLAYAAEWWAFGLFAVVLAARWVRDNGRKATTGDEGAADG
jgi:cytochrome oxidase assembly protein ShyY1